VARLLRLVLVIAAAGAVIAGSVLVLAPYGNQLVNANRSVDQDIDLNLLDSYAVRSYVYASDGSTLTTWHGYENRSPVTLDTVPQLVIDAVLSVEDADFYNHGGVNAKGTFRALIENVSAGGIAQGGSTLTQQLVKNAILDNPDQNFGRKSQEAAIAVRLEQKLEKIAAENGSTDPVRVAKDIILEKYLNTAYFGSGAYGVKAAAEVYWGKSLQDLNISEVAMMAALIRNPSGYDPTLHPETAKKQRQIALDRMAQLGKITTDQARLYGQLPVPANRCSASSSDPNCGGKTTTEAESFFLDELRFHLMYDETSPGVSSFGIDVTTPGYASDDASPKARQERAIARKVAIEQGGYEIHTTLDAQAQAVADDVVAHGVPENNQCVAAAMVGVEPGGAVRILSSGAYLQPVCPGHYPSLADVDPADTEAVRKAAANQPNRVDFATSANNQVGSTWKVFTLLTAFEQGNAPSDQIGGPVSIDLGRTKGRGCVDDKFNPDGNQYCVNEGSGGSLDQATTSSSNSAFTRLYQVVGPQNVADLVHKLGVSNPDIVTAPAGALGTTTVSPLEMASAFSTIPNGGVHEPYYFVDRIEDRNGRTVYEHKGSGQQAVSKQSACLASQVLLHNVQSGTGTNAQLPRQPAAGKTGTTDKGADTWFVGFTPDLTTAVWMGNPYEDVDVNTIGGRDNFGGQFPATMWGAFMKRYQDGREVKQFPGCGNVRGNGSVKGKGDNRYVFGFATSGSNNK